jgi:hypothetical protein
MVSGQSFWEYPQRQLGDCSSPAYRQAGSEASPSFPLGVFKKDFIAFF